MCFDLWVSEVSIADVQRITPDRNLDDHESDIETPKVSVVITSFNYAKYVLDAMRSVRAQNYANFECFIVDDASTDGSQKLIREEIARIDDGRFELLPLTNRVGQTGAFRVGLQKASGPFVAFLDADDLWMPDFLRAHVVCQLNTSWTSGFSYSDAIVLGADREILQGTWMDCGKNRPAKLAGGPETSRVVVTPTALIQPFDAETDVVEFLEHPWPAKWHFAPTSGCVFRRGLLTEIFPESDSDEISADYHIEMMASLLTGSLAISKALFFYRLHGENYFASHPVVGGKSLPGPWNDEENLTRNDKLLEHLQRRYDRLGALFGDWTVHTAAKKIARVSRAQRTLFATNQPELYRRVFHTPRYMSTRLANKMRGAIHGLRKPFARSQSETVITGSDGM